jgi:hypothetical protein
MTEIFYKCTLESDIVLNNKMATEGSMTTLDYIPGSNFLGIVASEIYATLSKENAYDIFHSGKVSFGDALVSDGKEMSYVIPFSLFKDKSGKKGTWVHHFLDDKIQTKLRNQGVQLKQERSGFLNASGKVYKKLAKNLSLKSAQDRKERRSKEGAMFGFESLEKGQIFVFSVRFQDETYVKTVKQALEGTKKVGKSKTAQYGQVKIEEIAPSKTLTSDENTDFTIVYAESNLCFFNDYGQSTFQPSAQDFGFARENDICWEKSQIRTYSYSPWNFKRNTPNTQRDCISKGSVFYIKGPLIRTSELKNQVGEYTAEGLGRVIYNPVFLKADQEKADWDFKLIENDQGEKTNHDIIGPSTPLPKTALGIFLSEQKNQNKKELDLSEAVQEALSQTSENLKKISSSQWGGIRAYASNYTDPNTLRKKLFEDFLKHGIAYDKYWSKNNDQNLRAFAKIFDDYINHGTNFIVKFAAEMAKEATTLKNTK